MKKNLKLVVVFYITLLTFSLSLGIIYAFDILDPGLVGTDFLETFKIISINNLLIEVGVISISFLLSFIFVGDLVYFIYFLIKSFTVGFTICSFIKIYSFNGMLISLIYFILFLFIFLILFFLMYELIKLSKMFFTIIFFKTEININLFIKSIKKIIFIFMTFTIYNTLLYFIQTPIINLFKIIV